jgi:hypothetical protein
MSYHFIIIIIYHLNDKNWYWGFVHPIYYKVISVKTLRSKDITIEYDVPSNSEILSALGASDQDFMGAAKPKDFWFGFLDNILLRPVEHSDISSSTLHVVIPRDWYFATVYPESSSNYVELGTMGYMYGDNIRYKNYQRSPFIVYNREKLVAPYKIINGITVIDVVPRDLNLYRNQKAFYQYFGYMSNAIGTLPIHTFLTFNMYANANNIEFQKVYQAAPYGYEHGLLGEFYGATGGDIGPNGESLAQLPLWDFDGWGPDKQPHLWHTNMIRPWVFLFIQFDPFAPWFKGGFATYYENMTAAQKYGLSQIIERRFKPMYKYYIDHIVGSPEKNPKNSWGHDFQTYYKPSLTAYYIDQLLKENSGGTKNINNLMKRLFQKAKNGRAINREIFTNALNSLTSYDFTQIVDNYLYDDGRLPLDAYLK